jgi:hypothetical protein
MGDYRRSGSLTCRVNLDPILNFGIQRFLASPTQGSPSAELNEAATRARQHFARTNVH